MVEERLAAFCEGDAGGNPAGVVICNELPDPAEMQAIAKEVGYSETAFAAPIGQDWRVRYFAPEIEVPFCGHATIALGAALAMQHGDGSFRLRLNDSLITVEGRRTDAGLTATLHSPPTRSEPAGTPMLAEMLQLFNYRHEHLDPSLPPAVAEAGARHLIVALANRALLAAMSYDLSAGREMMLANGLATISLIHAARPSLFHSRNAFAAGGVYEDPATGAAAAALAGYLRDRSWPHNGSIVIRQGEDMGVPSRLYAEISPEPGASIRVSGSVRVM
ncbi:PhzF family phenazine biosynthesis protein [Methylocystis sp. 9N]|uniref:PhzF family phenazine biosynthesis protein n=1 Tax=Methylocystis borbori TaxID=3118750 RepID=A0ABU7XD27_9HYPH